MSHTPNPYQLSDTMHPFSQSKSEDGTKQLRAENAPLSPIFCDGEPVTVTKITCKFDGVLHGTAIVGPKSNVDELFCQGRLSISTMQGGVPDHKFSTN